MNADNRLTVKEILEIANKFVDDYEVVAIRSQYEEFSLGPINHQSCVWDDGEETDELLDGISATAIESYAMRAHSSEWDWQSGWYSGDHQAIICRNIYDMGQDDGEVVIEDPVIVAIIK